jgi:uncharacterized membrane protein YdjX (TVP38/TMEM64 family)
LHQSLIEVEKLGAVGAVVFIFIYNIATLLFVPGSLLTIKGGCLFGLVEGSIYVLIAATLGATWAFLLGRYFSRDWISQAVAKYPKFQAIDRAVAQAGWKIVFLTRLCPIFPFNLLNYGFGVTQISLRDYIIGSVGMLPGTVMYVYIGSLATDIATANLADLSTTPETKMSLWVLRIVGLIATIAMTLYLTRLAKGALNQSILDQKAHATTKKP